MSGRPSEQSHFAWAETTTAYPAGADPWAAGDTAVQPGADVFTPDQPMPAEHLNFVVQGAARNYQPMLSFAGNMPALSFASNFYWDPAAVWSVTGACYDSTRGLWLYAGTFDTFQHVHGFVLGYAPRIELFGGWGSQPHGPGHIAPGVNFAWTKGDGVCHRWSFASTTTPHTSSAFVRAVSIVHETSQRAFTFFVRSLGATTVLSSPDATTWTDKTSGLVSTPTSNRYGVCQGADRIIAYKNHTAASSYLAFGDATTGDFTEGSFGAAWAANDRVQAMGFSRLTGTHLAALYNTVSGNTKIVSSTDDGDTWVTVATFAKTNLNPLCTGDGTFVALGAYGTLWIGLLRDVYNTGSPAASLMQVCLSNDSGATWYRTDQILDSDVGTFADLPPGVLITDHRIAIFNDLNVGISSGACQASEEIA